MAYDFGTNTLGIKNPFKPEGITKTISGIAICILGIIPLLGIAEALEVDMVKAWVNAGLGLILLGWGFRQLGMGLFQLFKYFVGRSVPTSLSFNFTSSEKDNAEAEKNHTVYSSQDIESMLMGRKNSTFVEPIGWLARLIHTVFPKLIFTPYPIRNFVQELGGLIAISLIAFIAYGVAYFVASSGLVGDAGNLITPILSIMLLVYLVIVWRATAQSLVSSKNRILRSKSAASLAKLLAMAIIIPVGVGFLYSMLEPSTAAEFQAIVDKTLAFSAWFNLVLFIVVSFAVIAASWVMINERFQLTNPVTEVSEYRENLQESIHPNEIFINIDTIVLANRRFKEIPNRTYQEFDPKLQEQSQGKGSFKGQLLIETQPEYQEINYSGTFKLFRLASTIVAQVLIVIAAVLFSYMIYDAYEIYHLFNSPAITFDNLSQQQALSELSELGSMIAVLLTMFFSWQTVFSGGKILSSGTNLFWSEMQFKSLLMWMKTEGTYTESKISTGMSIHDSTRSENVVVRSSITPWVISSRILTSTFATTGTQNLEMPRYILEMSKNTSELEEIVSEIKSFLKGRETIASITNEKDLNNAETIYQVNQASKSPQNLNKDEQKQLEEDAAGKLREDENNEST